jgi:hypothetical protein
MDYAARPALREPLEKGVWGTLDVDVVRVSNGAVLGAYERNYPSLFNTFWPFAKNGREFALYSRDYTATRVMELPSCRDIGGEERAPAGFCPVDYYVPIDPRTHDAADLGFVAGCVWGDDTSWKIQALDLSDVETGTISRDESFGYVELPDGVRLSDAIELHPWDRNAERTGTWIEIKTLRRYDMGTGRELTSSDV